MRALFKISRKFCFICFFKCAIYDILKFDISIKFEPFITNRFFVLIAVSIKANDISLFNNTGEKVVDPCAIQWMLFENIEMSATDKLASYDKLLKFLEEDRLNNIFTEILGNSNQFKFCEIL